ncbi:MAG: restriction endonuclease subunit S [Prevotella sp.]|nr:restriction endonuclease subunit S [Prevotella sp.]
MKAGFRFVYYALYNDYQRLASLANGGTQQNLNAQRIKDVEIPYLTLKEQH